MRNNFFKKIFQKSIDDENKKRNLSEILDDNQSEDTVNHSCITYDDACMLLKKLYSLYGNNISGLQLNTIFEGIHNNKIIKIGESMSMKAYKVITFTPSNYVIEIDRCVILNEAVEDFNDVYLLSIVNDDKDNPPNGFELCNSVSGFSYYKPTEKLKSLSETKLIVANNNKKYYDAIANFSNNLTKKCFSLPENQHYHTLVLKLLFSLFLKNNNSLQNKIISKSRELLSASIQQKCNINSNELPPLKIKKNLDFKNENDLIYFDAFIVGNAYIDAYNSLNDDNKILIDNIYEDWYILYSRDKRKGEIIATQ